MAFVSKLGVCVLGVGMLAGCASTDGMGNKVLPKGEQIGIRALIAAHPGQTACTLYDESSNSCASLISSRISGDTLIATEVAVVKNFATGAPQRVEVVTRGTIEGDAACVAQDGISVGSGSESPEEAAFIVDLTRDLVADQGGVCGTYFKSGDGYVVSAKGRNGQPFPPGDTPFQYVNGSPSLRAQ